MRLKESGQVIGENRYGKMLMALAGEGSTVMSKACSPGSKRKGTLLEPQSKRSCSHAVRYAITFGEVAILHIGGSELGSGRRAEGYWQLLALISSMIL